MFNHIRTLIQIMENDQAMALLAKQSQRTSRRIRELENILNLCDSIAERTLLSDPLVSELINIQKEGQE